jgi:hypothetical protein
MIPSAIGYDFLILQSGDKGYKGPGDEQRAERPAIRTPKLTFSGPSFTLDL